MGMPSRTLRCSGFGVLFLFLLEQNPTVVNSQLLSFILVWVNVLEKSIWAGRWLGYLHFVALNTVALLAFNSFDSGMIYRSSYRYIEDYACIDPIEGLCDDIYLYEGGCFL